MARPPSHTWVVVASGPSLTQEDVDYCRGRARVMVVSDNYLMAPWADALFAADLKWWDKHHAEQAIYGIPFRATVNAEAARRYHLQYYRAIGQGEFVGLSKRVADLKNSGAYALNVAFHLGARRILMLGFDFQHTGGKAHWFGNHPPGLQNAVGINIWKERLRIFAGTSKRAGLELVNCSRETSIKCITRCTIQEALP